MKKDKIKEQKVKAMIKNLKRKRKNKSSFSKRAVVIILTIALFDLQLSYVLAFLGRSEIAENLSQTVVSIVVGTILGYFCKAFFETREEEKLKYLKEKNKIGEEWKNE